MAFKRIAIGYVTSEIAHNTTVMVVTTTGLSCRLLSNSYMKNPIVDARPLLTMTLANASSVGQLKIIVRKDDNDSDDLIINVTSWTDGSSSNDIVLETGGAVICIALGAEGSLVWYPISVIGTGSSATV